jgi:LmbE family N-acetylglucosaminyl deacetylase
MSQHLFLSPHLDDVALSCGGTVARLVAEGAEVKVINIFAGSPNPADPISEFAHYQHTMWGNPQSAYETRRAEDAAAMACLGLEPIWLDFLDCIYRGQPEAGRWYYISDPDIFGQINPAEYGPALTIAAAVLDQVDPALAQPNFYAPLTVGHHIDHQLAFLAAVQLQARGYPVHFYEDYPYADRDECYLPEALESTTPALLKQAGYPLEGPSRVHWQSEVHPFSTKALEMKIRAIAAYATQLEVLFGGRDAMAERVTAYARQVGQTGPAERFWRLS